MEDPADDQAMMEAMGFSSFGMQKPANKKRKYNPNADASFEKAKKPVQSSSGVNSMPLGSSSQRQQPAAQPPTNTDEISLNDDDDDEKENAEGTLEAAEHGSAAQIGAESNLLQPLPAHLAGLPARPANGAGSWPATHYGNQNTGRPDKGVHNPLWYDGYYDHGSNENPWAALEKRHGLKPLGAWPSNPTTTTTTTT